MICEIASVRCINTKGKRDAFSTTGFSFVERFVVPYALEKITGPGGPLNVGRLTGAGRDEAWVGTARL